MRRSNAGPRELNCRRRQKNPVSEDPEVRSVSDLSVSQTLSLRARSEVWKGQTSQQNGTDHPSMSSCSGTLCVSGHWEAKDPWNRQQLAPRHDFHSPRDR